MLYGLGAPDISDAVRALPACYSQELSNCLDHGNVNGLSKTVCDRIVAGYDKDTDGMNDAINNLPVCEAPSMAPYVGGAFALGVLAAVLVLKKH